MSNETDPLLPKLDRKHLALIVACLGLLTLYYAFVTSAGKFELTKWHTDYYDLLARGWLRGHLYLPIDPAPKLLRRANPFNYKYVNDWLWDASLYKGRYYLYWGPVPGLWLYAWKLITQLRATIHDQWLVLGFMAIRLYAGAALIVLYVRTQAPSLPGWVTLLAIVVFGVANPTPYFMVRPMIYEASIAAGQAFVFCGLLAAYVGLIKPLVRTRSFVVAGVCFSMALGSRGSLIIVAPILVVVTALAANHSAGYPRQAVIRSLLALGLPVLCAVVMLLVYNKLRFESFSEFGLKYQLTSPPYMSKRRFVLPNIVSYLTSDVEWSCKFPFARLPMGRELTTLIRWPRDYDIGDWDKGERTGGILFATSICWLWCLWLWRAARGAGRALRRPATPASVSTGELWLLGCAIALVLGLAPATRMWMANQRFLQDAAGGIVIGALGAGIWLLKSAQPSKRLVRRALANGLFVVLALHTIITGLCLGFTGHMDNFRQENPALFERLEERLSVCE